MVQRLIRALHPSLGGALAVLVAVLPVAAQNYALDYSLAVTEDIPEEVLRAEIYTEARSPVDGRLLSASEYAELEEHLASLENIPSEGFISEQVRELVGLQRLRQFLRRFVPFVP